ncbi:hypothetical protein D3C80_1732380 [compost metagenome]
MRLCPTLIQEISTQVQIFIISGSVIQLHQCQLNFLMTIVSVEFIRFITEDDIDIVGKSGHNIQQFSFACCIVIGYTRLDHMSCTI